MTAEKDHYIICMEEQSREGTALFWKAEGKGYTSDVNLAGLFTKENAESIEKNSHKDNVAIPKDKLASYFSVYLVAGFDSQTISKLGCKK